MRSTLEQREREKERERERERERYTPWCTVSFLSVSQQSDNSIGWTRCSRTISISRRNLVLTMRNWKG